MDYSIALPSKPRIVSEEKFTGVYEIDGLHPGYGQTLGNSLRRIVLSSLPGAAIIAVRIEGVAHEFSTLAGVKEDVISIILNLKKVRIEVATEGVQTLTLKKKGVGAVTAGDITTPGAVSILNPEFHIADLTSKDASIEMEIFVDRGLGYLPKEVIQKEKVDVGTIALDATFTPIRRAMYEVENMRVGDRTDFNRLRMFIETDGTITPRRALEQSIEIMIHQLKSIIGFREDEKEEAPAMPAAHTSQASAAKVSAEHDKADTDALKTRIEELEGLSTRTVNSLTEAGIRTLGGLARKAEADILSIEGIGEKGLTEVKRILANFGIMLKN